MKAKIAALYSGLAEIKDLSDLIEVDSKTPITYGVIKGSYTERFFRSGNNPLCRRMWKVMNQEDTFVRSAQEGVAKVLSSNGTFVFFIESPFAEWHVRNHCDLRLLDFQIGPELKYCLILRHKSPLTKCLNDILRILKSKHFLKRLFKRWWPDRDCAKTPIPTRMLPTEYKLERPVDGATSPFWTFQTIYTITTIVIIYPFYLI
ncbi:unnamed protein product [Dimorphilus gyrociliatus]|nr:unnamed protein product [Dimorphilus gyrociliatus]